jgi:hypothetical protein
MSNSPLCLPTEKGTLELSAPYQGRESRLFGSLYTLLVVRKLTCFTIDVSNICMSSSA